MDTDVRKNLIYFIYYNGKLGHYHVLNLSLLRAFWNVFDGQKIVKIAVDSNYSIHPILDLLPLGCEYRIVKNIQATGEAYHFLESLAEVSGGMTFYAHCKGVTRPIWRGLDTWITYLYRKNLERVPKMGDSLFAGVLGKLLKCPPYVPEEFHYSGSFYWMNTDKVKSRLNKITLNKYLTERFPAIMAKKEECIFGFGTTDKNLNFYDERTWREIRR